jgi:hypothetical protein
MKSASSALMGAILLGCQGAAAGALSVDAVRPTAAGLNQAIGEPSTPISRTIQSVTDASKIPIRHVHDSNCGCNACRSSATSS